VTKRALGSEEFIGELRRIMWALSGDNRSGEPVGADRKRIMRQIRRIGEKGTDSIDGKVQTGGARFVEVLFANAERARQDPDFLKGIPWDRRYEYMAKPWKGQAGRKAKSKRSDDKRQLALELDRQGLTQPQIAKRISRSERTVRTYLNRKF
jgi:DNA-directed RNA polymerase specialized sigma24 family protein